MSNAGLAHKGLTIIWGGMKALGVTLIVVGLALAIYSVPFVTGVAFAFFLIGVAGFILGLRIVRMSH